MDRVNVLFILDTGKEWKESMKQMGVVANIVQASEKIRMFNSLLNLVTLQMALYTSENEITVLWTLI